MTAGRLSNEVEGTLAIGFVLPGSRRLVEFERERRVLARIWRGRSLI
jgi:hypothetical protein